MKPPILRHKRHGAPSVFQAGNLLREARRQKGLAAAEVPEICLLDPDGDILSYLRDTSQARPVATWACYHSEMFEFQRQDQRIGIVGNAVGAPYAVLLAEQMFASGCRMLISITSSGQLKSLGETPYYVLAEEAWRDEGTSYHYLPPADFAAADPKLIDAAWRALADGGLGVHADGGLGVHADGGLSVHKGRTWTTDAPFRETQVVIEEGRAMGLAAIEMETAALYAFAAAKAHPVLCFAHVTNTMAVTEVDFEKGDAHGALDSLRLLDALLSGGLDALL